MKADLKTNWARVLTESSSHSGSKSTSESRPVKVSYCKIIHNGHEIKKELYNQDLSGTVPDQLLHLQTTCSKSYI